MKQLIIAVTARDIKSGRRRSCTRCPIALSLQRRGFKDVNIDYEIIETRSMHCRITRHMENWMSAFDAGLPVKPTSFFTDAGV